MEAEASKLHACTRRPARRPRRTREAPGATRTKVLRPPSFWLGSQLGDGDRARSKSWCDRSAQADRTQQPSSSVASGFVLFFPSSPRPRSFEFVTLLNSMNDGLHEGNQPGTKPFIGYKPAFDCPSMHISCDPQDYLTFARCMHSAIPTGERGEVHGWIGRRVPRALMQLAEAPT